MRRTFASFAKTGSKASGPAKTFGAVARLSAPLEGNVVSQCYTRARFAETIESSRKSVVEERLLNANSAASSMMATPVSGRAVPQSLVAASATNVRSVDSERSPSTFSSVMPLSLGMVVASSLRPVSLISDVTTVEGSASASTSSSSPSLPPSVSVSSSPLTLESNILEQHARGQLDGIYEVRCCAEHLHLRMGWVINV